MYKVSELANEYKRKLITADKAAAMVINGSRIHFGLGCGTVIDIDKALAKRADELKDGLLPCPKAPRRYWQFYDWAKDLDNEYLESWEGDRFDAPLNLFCILTVYNKCFIQFDKHR